MRIIIDVCEICGYEYRSDKKHHWSDCVDSISFIGKNHSGIQFDANIICCSRCGLEIINFVKQRINIMRDKYNKEAEIKKL